MSANDVALHILETEGPMGTMKLQKLVFYSQAYSLAWFNEPMFDDEVQAWIHGPVVPALWRLHQKLFDFDAERLRAKDPDADPENLTPRDKLIVKSVLAGVGSLNGLDLRDRTHKEAPWKDAFDSRARYHNTVISPEAMRDYYSMRS